MNENNVTHAKTPDGRWHCYHCRYDWWPHQSGRPKKCPNCQCKSWDVAHAPGFHRTRQPRLLPKAPILPEGAQTNAP